jgi:uncharacterized membrane protein YuzA (DUF378 family)
MPLPEELTINTKYTLLIIQKFALAALIVGAINWLFIGLFDINLVTGIFGQNMFSRTLFVLVGFAALFLMFHRDFYLPFLGQTVMPCGTLEDKTPSGADTSITVNVLPNSKILYWAAEPETDELKKIHDWKKAYASFKNIGVTTSNEAGTALLKVRKPQAYSVPFKRRLEPHIHYRVCNSDGMMERVNTVYITDSNSSAEAIEGFTSVTTGVDPNKLISEFTKDPKKFMDGLSMAVPQISQVMEALNNQFVTDMHRGAEAHQATEQLDGGAITEAFRNY